MALKQILADKADKHLVDEWRSALNWLSVKLAIVVGVLGTFAISEPQKFADFMELIPADIRPIVGLFFTTLLPIYLRLKKQGTSGSENTNGDG